VIEITDLLEELLNVGLIRQSSVCPSAFPSNVATACLTRSALLEAMMLARRGATTCWATANPMPDDPPSTTIRFSESSL